MSPRTNVESTAVSPIAGQLVTEALENDNLVPDVPT